MSRQTAEKLAISEAKVLQFRTRSGSIVSTPLSGYISTPLSTYKVVMESFEQKLERVSLEVDSYATYSVYDERWRATYADTYDKISKTLTELDAEAPPTTKEVVDGLKKTLDSAKKDLDKKVKTMKEGAVPRTAEDQQVGKQPDVRAQVEGVRLLSESSEMFLDTTAESDMLQSLRYLSKGAPNLDRVSKLATNVSNVTIGQQHALRVVRTDLQAISRTVDQFSSTGPRITNLESQVINMQASLNNTVASNLQCRQEMEAKLKDNHRSILERISVLESMLQSTPIPPVNSTINDNSIPVVGAESDRAGRPLRPPGDVSNRTAEQGDKDVHIAESGMDARKVLTENAIRGLISQSRKILAISVNEEMPDQLIADCYAKKIPSLNSIYEKLNKSLDKYLSVFSSYDDNLIEIANDTMQDSLAWIASITDKYDREEIYRCPSNIKESLTTLDKFDPEGEITIFEFFAKFERKFKGLGSNIEKAEKLWSEYLTDVVKIKTESVKSSFKELKSMLIKKYGSLNYILENCLSILEKVREKTTLQYSSRLALYTKVLLILQKLSDAREAIAAPKETWDNMVYGVNTMDRLIKLMTPSEWDMFACKLTDKDLDTDEVQGELSFELFKVACKTCVNSLTRLASAEKKKPQPVNSFFNNPAPLPQRKPRGKRFKKELKCPFSEHNHALANCEVFWKMSPEKKKEACVGKSCLSCFKKCVAKCQSKVPAEMICDQCSNHDKVLINKIFCSRHQPAAKADDLATIIQNMVPGVNLTWLQQDQHQNKNQVNCNFQDTENVIAKKTPPQTFSHRVRKNVESCHM